MILIDIDHFKDYNDCFGHPAGDECLRVIAKTIQGCLRRSGDVAARYGGEEIAVLLPATSKADALALAETMRLAVNKAAIKQAPGRGGVVTFSAGVSTGTPADGGTFSQTLIRVADEALYAAKAAGRNVVLAASGRS